MAPEDERLLTQQGGCLVMEGSTLLYRHADSGILKYADVDAVAASALQGAGSLPGSQVLRTFM